MMASADQLNPLIVLRNYNSSIRRGGGGAAVGQASIRTLAKAAMSPGMKFGKKDEAKFSIEFQHFHLGSPGSR